MSLALLVLVGIVVIVLFHPWYVLRLIPLVFVIGRAGKPAPGSEPAHALE